MFAIETLIIVALLTLLVGAALGVLIGRAWVRPQQQKSLEQQLNNAQKSLDTYQQDVAKHFLETASKVSDLSQSYRDLHDHLSTGALSLANTEIGRELIAAGDQPPASERLEQTPIEAPKDWAPRTPGNEGTLSEDYGLRDSDANERSAQPRTEAKTKERPSPESSA